MKPVLRTTLGMLLALPICSLADSPQFELPVQLSVGLKAFATYLDEPLFTLDDGNVQAIRSKKQEVLLIPTLSARYDKFFATASYSPSHSFRMETPRENITEYALRSGQGALASYSPTFRYDITIKREEQDVNFGYALLPSASASVGYKKIKYNGTYNSARIEAGGTSYAQDWGTKINYLYQGPTVGFAATAPLGNGISLYGNLAMGVGFKLKIDDRSSSADYNAHEVGLSYVLPVKAWPMKSLLTTLGYRGQSLTSKSSNIYGDKVHIAERTEGFTLGVVAAF
jgi:hypothetical protein